jgi:uncharacterized protein with NRDE domain
MCLIIFDWQPESERILTLASNRDEFYQRPSSKAQYWPNEPHIYGGKDLEMGGTWLAVSRTMRLAAITNFRTADTRNYTNSRGEIPSQFLNSGMNAIEFAEKLRGQHYAGFNALLFDGSNMVYCSNHATSDYTLLSAGCYGLSNHLLNTPWPKVEHAKQALALAHEANNDRLKSKVLLDALQNSQAAEDYQLPDTGVGLELERLLSPIFITSPVYGTRTSTAIMIDKSGKLGFTERTFETGEQHKGGPLPYKETYQEIFHEPTVAQ